MDQRLHDIVRRNGTFPAADLVVTGFTEAMALAEAGGAPAPDLAEAFVTLVDQLGTERQDVPPDLGARLTAWARTVEGDPSVPATAITFLLVNAATEASYARLQALATGCARADLQAAAETMVADHPLAPKPQDEAA
jgi:hypothetical protein